MDRDGQPEGEREWAYIHEMSCAWLIVDRAGCIVESSEEFAVLLGRITHDVVGRSVSALVPLHARDDHPSMVEEWFSSGRQARPMSRLGSEVFLTDRWNNEIPVKVSLMACRRSDHALAIVMPQLVETVELPFYKRQENGVPSMMLAIGIVAIAAAKALGDSEDLNMIGIALASAGAAALSKLAGVQPPKPKRMT